MTPEELQALIQGNRQQSLAPRNPGGMAIDPIILEEIARGRTAGNELAGINAQIEQLRGRKMAIPQGFSAPGVYQAASPLAFLAAFLSDSAKGKKIADLSEQAKALRGDVTIGDEAALQREQLMKQAQLENQYSGLSAQARMKNAMLREEKEARESEKISGHSLWVNEAGDVRQVAKDSKGRYVDPNTDPPQRINLEGYVKAVNKDLLDEWAPLNLGPTQEKDVYSLRKRLGTLAQVNQAARKLTQEDIAMLSEPGWDVVFSLAPTNVSTYLENQQRKKGLSARAADYLTKINRFAAEDRHALSGAALTEAEIKYVQTFLPGGAGLSFLQNQQRINSSYQELKAQLDQYKRGRDDIDLLKGVQKYEPFELPETLGPQVVNPPTEQPMLNDEQKAKLRDLLTRKMQSGG